MKRCVGRVGRTLALALSSFVSTHTPAYAQATPPPIVKHPLSIDEVLATEHLDRATLSPDGEWVAAVVGRGAKSGEVYGRTAYEVDPSRDDIWLISTRTGERRRLTDGAPRAAGYWCATWSPDGQRLAMLSTQPEAGEPRGGDNARLYVWSRDTGRVIRMGSRALMTQTRYGGELDRLDLRGGANGKTAPFSCSNDQAENAPFLWLDDNRLLTVTLPEGEVSGLLDQYGRPFRVAARDAATLRGGQNPTARAVGSGAERVPFDRTVPQAVLRIVKIDTREVRDVATVPIYPFRGALSIAVSPDGRRLAVLATLGALPPEAGRTLPNAWDNDWTVDRRLGFVDLAPNSPMRWATPSSKARYPLELYSWSPDSHAVALRARADQYANTAALFVADARNGRMTQLGPAPIAGAAVRTDAGQESAVVWVDHRRLVARLEGGAAKTDWWLLTLDSKATNLTAGGSSPAGFRRAGTGALVAIRDDQLIRLDLARRTLALVARLSGTAAIVAPVDSTSPSAHLVVSIIDKQGKTTLQRVSAATGVAGPSLPVTASANVTDADAEHGQLVFSESGQAGLFLRLGSLTMGGTRDLLALDTGLAAVDWGRTRLIDYHGADGKPLHGAVILPPGYMPGRSYPTLVWVYQGYQVRALEGDYWLDPFLPGIYNLQLYAARGYAVLIPSIPRVSKADADQAYGRIVGDVLPAVDTLVSLGIADPDRLGVMGQSRGGYTVYALVTQTNRFKAAVAFAGISDLASFHGEFDPTARGYPGIEHEKSDNWAEISQFGLSTPPSADRQGYARISPLAYAERVTTPLLMIHGEADIRGSATQAEEFFSALYDQGKTAELIRYGGESHSLAQSPANVRDIFSRTMDWFDKYVGKVLLGQ